VCIAGALVIMASPLLAAQPDNTLSNGEFLIIIILVGVVIYFSPAIIAFNRKHRNRWVILAINFVFGGTLIAWVLCLVWSLNKFDDPIRGGQKLDIEPEDPFT
jgi:hypothetical protein